MEIISYIGSENNIFRIEIDFEEEIDSLEELLRNYEINALFSLTIS